MYEAHFGLKAPPFSLNPDPEFFFGSRDHAHALAYLRYGVYQSEGFVVVTGEIGAGKTTLVRTLLSELDQEKIVAAQIVSTQLEANDLLRSVALAFGIAPKSLTKAELIATIEAYLTMLVTQGKRALLIIDEAQNLSREAVEELRMLSNFQFGNRSLMQSFLVGQPELRALLTSKPMEQFRQRVIASCHVGPMSLEETRHYIEHRLKTADWRGNPAIGADAFEEVFRATEGIPRRVNLLCNRVLLAAYLQSTPEIRGEDVAKVVVEVRSELGVSMELAPDPEPEPALPPVAAAVHATLPTSITAQAAAPAGIVAGAPLIFVAGDRDEDLQLSALMRACQSATPQAPGMLRVRMQGPDAHAGDVALADQISGDVATITLQRPDGTSANRVAVLLVSLEKILSEHGAAACVVCGSSEVALGAALAAQLAGCPVVHVNPGSGRVDVGDTVRRGHASVIERIAQIHYTTERAAYFDLIRAGASETRVHLGRPLYGSAVRAASAVPMVKRAALKQAGAPIALADGRRGYALALLDASAVRGKPDALRAMVQSLGQACQDMPVVWPLSPAMLLEFEAAGIELSAELERVAVVAPLEFAHMISLLRGASLLATDEPDACNWAATFGVKYALIGSRQLAQQAVPLVEGDDESVRGFADLLVASLPTVASNAAAERNASRPVAGAA